VPIMHGGLDRVWIQSFGHNATCNNPNFLLRVKWSFTTDENG